MATSRSTTSPLANAQTLIVCGTFNAAGGRHSGYAEKLLLPLVDAQTAYYNGGSLELLDYLVTRLQTFDIIIWFPDVPNSHVKHLPEIKSLNKKCLLVISKNNIDNKYTFLQLVARALDAKANLSVEFTKRESLIQGRVFDPLGNQFNDDPGIDSVRVALVNRLEELSQFSRSESEQIGEDSPIKPNEDEFFDIVRRHAEKLFIHSHTESVNPTRFVGNLSFRCLHGFPSCRDGDIIFVSRRNIDKRGISIDGMIPVVAGQIHPVRYYGFRKPSVDTPVQVKLYEAFPRIRYMFHAHAYLPGARFTNRIIPCGALEEADELISMFPDKNAGSVVVNLRGHGCLIMADSLDPIRRAEFTARIIPERLSLDIEA